MADEFKLTPPDAHRNGHGGRRSGAGRPHGTKNRLVRKLNEACFRSAAREVPEVLAGVLKRAKRLNEPHWAPNATDAGLATWVLEHFWAVPRSAPIQIDMRDGSSMQDALEAGDLTPSDYAGLVRASANTRVIDAAAVMVDPEETRKRLIARLEGAVRERQQSEAPPAAGSVGLHNPNAAAPAAAELATDPAADEDAELVRTLEKLADALEARGITIDDPQS